MKVYLYSFDVIVCRIVLWHTGTDNHCILDGDFVENVSLFILYENCNVSSLWRIETGKYQIEEY